MKTYSHTAELYADVMDSMLDYHQIGWTVCGAEDQAVIVVSKELGKKYPELAGLTVVRVGEHFINSNRSDTFLEFSDRELTPAEYAMYEEIADGL